jgi:Domain of unknown function (DUF4349)
MGGIRLWIGGAVLAVAVAAAACGSDSESSGVGGGGGSGAPMGREAEAGAAEARSVSAAPLDLPAVGPTVIKTADLAVEVERDGLGEAVNAVTTVAGRYGGFVVSSTTGGADARRGTLTLRVPSDRFEEALADLAGLGTLDRRWVSGEDVSQEFVDLEARLRNLGTQEAVMLRLFDEAATVSDTIRIQRELSGVQLQIEEIEGRLRYLRDQTAMSTITVELAEEGATAPGVFDQAFDRALDGFFGVIAALVVVMGYVLPVAAIAGLILIMVRRLWSRAPGTAGG